MTTPLNADMTKCSRYHRNHDHTIEECKALQDKIEELVCASHFRRFVRRDDHPPRSNHPPRSDHRRPPATLATTNTQAIPQTMTPNWLAPTSPLPTLPDVALLTPSLVVLLVEDPPNPPGRDIRLEPVKETIPLELPNGRTIKLGTGYNLNNATSSHPPLSTT